MRTLLVGIVVVAIGACAPDEPSTATSTAAITSSNALTTNALSQNGMFQNGMFQNGMFQNGMFQNGLYQGDLFRDGVLQDGLWRNEVWQSNPAALEVLRTNPYTRQVLQYIYGCAMRPARPEAGDPGQSVILYPGDPPSPDAPPGDSRRVELKGEIGLWPDWGRKDGTCGLSCQRWVSACVLARTNAYGATVKISMRVADDDDVPPHIKSALKVSQSELAEYPQREGAFYGNIFQTTLQSEGEPSKIAPEFYACAGPASNIPQITKRFCSSQGAEGPITVVGTCKPPSEIPVPSVCDNLSPAAGADGAITDSGALHHCFTSKKLEEQTDDTKYTEVITVYIKDLISVYGDSVCDEKTENTESHPSDCHPDSRARTIPYPISTWFADLHPYDDDKSVAPLWGLSALGPDNRLVVLGTQPIGPTSGDGGNVLAQYDEDHNYLWGRRFGLSTPFYPRGVAVASDTSIVTSGWVPIDNSGRLRDYILVTKFYPPDNSTTPPSVRWTVTSSGPGWARTTDAPAIDHQGNVLIAGDFGGEITIAAHIGTQTLQGSQHNTFIAKISPDGNLLWATRVGEWEYDFPVALTVDLYGDIFLAQYSFGSEIGLRKLSGQNGKQIPDWERRGYHGAIVTDAYGDVYATGSLARTSAFDGRTLADDSYNFGLPSNTGLGDFFVVKYRGHDAEVLNVYIAPMSCPMPRTRSASCGGRFDGLTIALAPPKNQNSKSDVIVGIHGGNHRPIDFGSREPRTYQPKGELSTYKTKDVFVTAFSHDLEELRWVKHMPMFLNGVHHNLAIDSRGRITMSGSYDGSMQIDDRLLINNIPELEVHPNTFLATFAMPSPEADMAPPTMDHVPSSMVVEATSPEGAKVFFMPPTVIDDGNAGTTVSCAPAPSTIFPIRPTLVTCTASDPFGKQSLETFTVDVVDTTGPAFSGVRSPITVETIGPAGAIVSFETPTAVDLVDGLRPVTCSHSSGTMFPIGTTVVQCSSSDTKGQQTQTAFGVTVLLTWSGVLSPIHADGASSFRLGSTITVKFQLTGASSSITNAVATLSLVKLSPNPTGTVIEATSPGNHNTGNSFRYDARSGQYIYNLSTKPLSAGTWSLRIDPGDGVPRAVTISLHE